MDEYTLRVGERTYRLAGSQLDVVRVGARLAHRWGEGLPVTISTVEGAVTLPPPEDLRAVDVRVDGPWERPHDNPWSRPG